MLKPGKPTDNAHVESFDGTFGTHLLNAFGKCHAHGRLVQVKDLF